MIYPILIILALMLIYDKRVNSDEVGGSKNFHLSEGMSKQTYIQMRTDGLDGESLKKFVQL